MSAPQLTADFYKGSKLGPKYWLDINEIADGQRFTRESIGVSGKAEARRIAQQLGATPWNF